MPCCAGTDGTCATGACKGALFKRPETTKEEKLCGAEDASGAHGAGNHSHPAMQAQAAENADHCDSDKKEAAPDKRETQTAGSQKSSSEAETNFVSAHALAAPCKDCCAGASTSTQSRRGRDSVLISPIGGLLPPSFISLSSYALNLQPVPSAHLQGLRGRAPPSITPSNPA